MIQHVYRPSIIHHHPRSTSYFLSSMLHHPSVIIHCAPFMIHHPPPIVHLHPCTIHIPWYSFTHSLHHPAFFQPCSTSTIHPSSMFHVSPPIIHRSRSRWNLYADGEPVWHHPLSTSLHPSPVLHHPSSSLHHPSSMFHFFTSLVINRLFHHTLFFVRHSVSSIHVPCSIIHHLASLIHACFIPKISGHVRSILQTHFVVANFLACPFLHEIFIPALFDFIIRGPAR